MKSFLFVILFSLSLFSLAQENSMESFNHWSIDIGVGVHKPLALPIEYTTHTPDFIQGNINTRYMLNEKFGLSLDLGYSQFEARGSSLPFSSKYYRANIKGIINVGNILDFSDWDDRINLLAHGGAGVSWLFSKDNNEPVVDRSVSFVVGLTPQVKITNRITMFFDFYFVTHLLQDYTLSGAKFPSKISRRDFNASILNASVGLSISLGKNKIPADWYYKKQSKDSVSKTTTTPQLKIIDTDKDGVMDQLDVEPNTPEGLMVYGNGKAVDSDKDGVQDYKDKCPLKVGPISNQGCPIILDEDGDGIVDSKDKCPNKIGAIENNGCPEKITETEKITEQIELLATSIYFDASRDKIKNISYATLDEIIFLMKETLSVKFVIEGHTDNIGSDRTNLYLSQKRAASVRRYMIMQGINPKRLKSIGYGESRPKYSNETEGGRQLNRRVAIVPVKSFD